MRSYFFRLLSIILFGGLLLGAPSSASAQTLEDVVRYSERLPAPGSSLSGMSGAGLFAGPADPDALFGNPAGMGWMESSTVGGDFAIHRAREDTRFLTPDANALSDRTVSDYRIGRLAGAVSFPTTQGSLVMGASFHQSNTYERGFDVLGDNRTNSITGTLLPAANGFEVDGEDLIFDATRSRIAYEAGAIDFSNSVYEDGGYPFFQGADPGSDAADGQMVLEQQEDLLESGQLNEISFGAAVEVAPRVMVGAGLNIAFGQYRFERFYRETDASGLLPPENPNNPQPPYDPYFLEGTNLEGFDEFQLEERIDADLSGVNLRLGLSAQPIDPVRAGLKIETPTRLNVTEVYGTEMWTFFDCDFSSGSCVRPEEPFSSGSLTGNEFDYTIQTPWRIGGGLQFSQSGLTLAGDVELVDWTQAEISADNASFSDLNRQIQDLDATFTTRLGAEYALDAVAVRAGIAHHPDPRDRSFQSIDGTTTDGDRLFFSAGVSYTFNEQSTLHVSWLQERFDDRFQSYVNLPESGPLVREEVIRNRVLVGLTYHF